MTRNLQNRISDPSPETEARPRSFGAAEKQITTVAALRQAISAATPILAANAIAVDRDARYPYDSMQALHRLGLFGIGFSKAQGGLDFGRDTPTGIYFEALGDLAAACSNTAQLYSVQTSAVAALTHLGSEAQQSFFRKPVFDDGATFSFVGSEPTERFTSDGKRVHTDSTVTRTADGWRVNARKSFVTGSIGASYILLLAMVDGVQDPSHLVTVIVPTNDPAVRVEDTWDNMGQRATTSGLLVVTDCEVPEDFVIGAPGSLIHAKVLAPFFQIGFTAMITGIAQGALDFTIDYVRNKQAPTAGYESAAHEPNIQQHISDMATAIAASRGLIERASKLLDRLHQGEDIASELWTAVYQARVFAAQVAVDVPTKLFQICGARSTTNRFAADRFWRNARTLSLHDNIDKQKGVVGRYLLGIEAPTLSIR